MIRTPEHKEFKRKEQLGDALLKFIAMDIYFKKYSEMIKQIKTSVSPVDIFVCNSTLIKVAEDVLFLTPNPEDLAEHQRIAIMSRNHTLMLMKLVFMRLLKHKVSRLHMIWLKQHCFPNILSKN